MIKNKWKILFFILAIVNVVVIGSIYFLVTSDGKNNPIENKPDNTSETIPFTTQTNKLDLNKVINHYLKQQAKGSINYQIFLDNNVNLIGTLPIFGQNVEMKMSFKPTAVDDGNLILKEKDFSIGALKLPAEQVLKMINNHYQFPEWVTIQPNEKNVLVDLQNMNLKSGLIVRMEKIDLKQDKIMFTILVPIEKTSNQSTNS